MSRSLRSRVQGRLQLSASTYSQVSQATERPSDAASSRGRGSSATHSSDRSRQKQQGGIAPVPPRQEDRKRAKSAHPSRSAASREYSPPAVKEVTPAFDSPSKKPAKVPRVKRPRAPPPPPCHFQNVVMYYDVAGNVIMKETVDDVIGLPPPKRKKNNQRVEDEMQAVYYLLDPLTLEQVESTESTPHTGIFVKKEMMQYNDIKPGLRIAQACTTPSVGAHHMNLYKKSVSPAIIVDKKRLVGMVLYTERQKVMVKWQRQEVLLSQWDFFTMDSDEEFIISNLSNKTVARIQILEWV